MFAIQANNPTWLNFAPAVLLIVGKIVKNESFISKNILPISEKIANTTIMLEKYFLNLSSPTYVVKDNAHNISIIVYPYFKTSLSIFVAIVINAKTERETNINIAFLGKRVLFFKAYKSHIDDKINTVIYPKSLVFSLALVPKRIVSWDTYIMINIVKNIAIFRFSSFIREKNLVNT